MSDRAARWDLVSEDSEQIVIRDVGPWEARRTVTNDAESVVEEVGVMISDNWTGRRLFYYDSEGELGELLVRNGKFAGFGDPHSPRVETYLGDGVYASFDGYHVVLDLRAQGPERIALEPAVFEALRRFAGECWGEEVER